MIEKYNPEDTKRLLALWDQLTRDYPDEAKRRRRLRALRKREPWPNNYLSQFERTYHDLFGRGHRNK